MVAFLMMTFTPTCGSNMQLKIPTYFSKDGSIGSLSTNTETSSLLEKAMQVTMFLNCLSSFTEETKELQIQS